MKTGLVVLGVLLVLVGAAWVGQGLGYIKGSFMSGDIHWFWIGVGFIVVGLVLLATAGLRRTAKRV